MFYKDSEKNDRVYLFLFISCVVLCREKQEAVSFIMTQPLIDEFYCLNFNITLFVYIRNSII